MAAFMRNPSFARQMIVLVGVEAVVCVVSFVFAGTAAGLAACAASLAACALFCVFSFLRYREIMRLASEIDEVLHGGRRVDFTDCREGDVAVLRNEVSKMTVRLSRTAEQLDTEKNALAEALADVSHQIRTPLTAIELMVPIIERADGEEERARRLHELESMVDRVSWLVTSLLKMARFDAGAARLQKRSVDAATVARAAVEPLAIALDIRGIECSIDADGVTRFEGDQAWTTEAVGNIVKNCMEHTPTGGAIAIRVTEDTVAVRISVSDTGPGISDEDLPHVFERFYRGSPTITRKQQGFGIGLALAQSYISAQGGTLRASNQDTGGARFDITFPKMTV